MTRPVVVVTNDDGIASPGLAIAANTARAHPGLDDARVIIVAPTSNMSGTSAAIGPGDPDITFDAVGAVGDVDAFVMEAPPAVAVLAAYEGHFGGPLVLVVSGINAGVNIGWGVLHSGTVGAALAAQNLGVSALALSCPPDATPSLLTRTAQLGLGLVDDLRARTGQDAVAANVNAATEPVTELRTATLAQAVGLATSAVGSGPGSAVPIRANTARLDEPDSDAALLSSGHATVSFLRGLHATDPLRV